MLCIKVIHKVVKGTFLEKVPLGTKVRVLRQHPRQQGPFETHYEASSSIEPLRRLYEGAGGSSEAQENHQASVFPYPRKPWGPWSRTCRPCETCRSSVRHQLPSTIPHALRHLRAPTDFQLPADHPVAALLCQVLSVRHQALLKTTGQQGPVVLVSHKSEVLTGHADPRTPGPFQTTNKVPPLFHSSFVRQFISSTAGPLARTREEKLKKQMFQQPFGCDNTSKIDRDWDQSVPIRVFACYCF